MSPPLRGETYCFCPVRLSVRVSITKVCEREFFNTLHGIEIKLNTINYHHLNMLVVKDSAIVTYNFDWPLVQS